ncbi:helix-turn-helix domain-containing protein [Nocardia sp. R7R-8]|uniref:helix-turn-helix domain-containing protein n=1 Tax=Nocardia sp. R7R-8 TaxID=3459304 RepID=UPI00403DF9C1
MGTFEDLEKALGIDLSDPEDALARDLVDADHDMLEELVRIRKHVANMSGSEVADRMGRHRSVVTNFEKLTADPHLSTIRRYAHAIGARVTHHVEWVNPRSEEHMEQQPIADVSSPPAESPQAGEIPRVRVTGMAFDAMRRLTHGTPVHVRVSASKAVVRVAPNTGTGR